MALDIDADANTDTDTGTDAGAGTLAVISSIRASPIARFGP